MILSVVIPVFNRQVDHLVEAMKAFADVEILIVDDCSSEPVPPFDAANVRVIRNERNVGAGESRNHGLEVAAGDYIFFLDSDDSVSATFIPRLLKRVHQSSSDILVISLGTRIGRSVVVRPVRRVTDGQFFSAMLSGRFFYTSPVDKVYRRKFLLDNRICFPPIRAYEDVIFVRLLALHARSVDYCPELVYEANLTLNSVSRNSKSHVDTLQYILSLTTPWRESFRLTESQTEAIRSANHVLVLYELFRFAAASSTLSAVGTEGTKLRSILEESGRRFHALPMKYRVLDIVSRWDFATYVVAKWASAIKTCTNEIKAAFSKLGT